MKFLIASLDARLPRIRSGHLLQAGASVKGEFENRLKNVIDEVKKSPKPFILETSVDRLSFLDQPHGR